MSSWELELGTTQSLNHVLFVILLDSDRQEDLVDVYSGNYTLRLSESTSHSSLESIGSSTTQHFVDAGNVERVHANPKMEGILTTSLDEILVGANTSGFECLR